MGAPTKGFDHLSLSGGLNTILLGMYNLRIKYRLNESGLWHLVHIYWYYTSTHKGCSITALSKKRYTDKNGYATTRQQIASLYSKNIIQKDAKGFYYPTEHVLKDIYNLVNPTEIIPIKPDPKRKKS